ncbi:unnamed protein product, partial [marine sediment metagenome]
FLAGRMEFPALTHGLNRYTTSSETELVEKNHAYNLEIIGRWLSGEADAAVLLNWREELVKDNKAELIGFIEGKLEVHYVLVATLENAHHSGQTLEIYLRKD